MKSPAAKQVVIANRLEDGLVVFLREDGRWVENIADATAVTAETRSAELLLDTARESEAKAEVVDPYLIDIAEQDGTRRPTVYREEIRVFGPTVQTGI